MSTKKKSMVYRKITNAKPEHYFILATGIPLKNLKELAGALENMNQWVFNHHVNDSRNDFARWVEDILGEKELAQELHSIKGMREMELRILKHLVSRYV